MKMLHRTTLSLLIISLILILAACNTAESSNTSDDTTAGVETDEHEEEADHEHPEEYVPNNGAAIHLVSPANNSTFKTTDDIIIQVEVGNFALSQDGNHWHIFVDGTEWSMIMTNDLEDVLRGLEPGEHEIAVYLANGDHQDLEEGDQIYITVEE